MPGSPLSAAAEIHDRLCAAGVVLSLEGGALRYSAPPGAFTEDLRAAARGCRDGLLELLRSREDGPQEQGGPQDGPDDVWRFTADPEAAGEPFPLTALQQAYLVGEQDFYDHPAPAVFVHEYAFPAGSAPDADTLDRALDLLSRAHGSLRLAVSPDGTQRILPVPDGPAAPVVDRRDLSALSAGAAESELAALRSRLAADLPDHRAGRPFLIRHVTLPDGTVRLQIALRLIAFDGVTTQLFFTELARCCADPGHVPRAVDLSFRDYVNGLEERRTGKAHRVALRHWERRSRELPPAPALPTRPHGAGRAGNTRDGDTAPGGAPLRRIATRLDAAAWGRFRAHATAAGLPAGTALFSLFAESLHRWSDGAAGTLTVLASHRPGNDPGLQRVWGNASTTVLAGYGAAEPGTSFVERCRGSRGALYADLAALEVSGVEVGRALAGGAGGGSPFPVVFTSGLDLVDGAPGGFLLPLPGARLAHSSISTPQVLLDHQVYEEAGELVCNFDYAEHAYPPGMIEELTAYHHARLQALADTDAAWHATAPVPLPSGQLRERRRANATTTDLPTGTLHSFVLERCRSTPDAPAVHDTEGTLSGAGLDLASARLARRLTAARAAGRADEPVLVGVRVPRGRAQSIAVLAVLRAGGAYVPIDPSWPAARVRTVLGHSGARALITAPWPDTAEAVPEGVEVVPWDGTDPLADEPAADPADTPAKTPPEGPADASAPSEGAADADADRTGGPLDRTAYVIYTSGSTGTPKGVVIPHAAAVNTLRDLTDRFGLTARDKVLAVSSLAFDLSVFDQFGLLGCGGAVVCPPESPVPDPEAWAASVRRHGVTVWNSVPALMALTLEYLGERARDLLASLRLVMLSGDWVPLSLVERLAEVCPDAEVIAMGGATEASIWSNWFRTSEQPEDWQSVPYGTPLANQTMHVLDAELADTPTWVPGDLHIGGAGVASGYRHDPERTAASFFPHPVTGEPLYRTGDRARYRADGVLEFLGRADHQVKINGYRVELGEIETQLARAAAVDTAVALVDTSRGEPFLAAFVVRPGAGAGQGHHPGPAVAVAADQAKLRDRLGEVLPPYMVPAAVLELPELPLSGNGKVDRKALLAVLDEKVFDEKALADGPAHGPAAPAEAPATPLEERLLSLWQELLGPAARGVDDDFFARGGNSLTAVRLFRAVETVFGRRLPLASLFRHRTVRAQAALLADTAPRAGGTGLLTVLGGTGACQVVFVHPVGGDVLCYQQIVDAVTAGEGAGRATLYGLRASGLHPGEPLADSVDAMAGQYARTLLEELPDGPLHLVGWSMGGTIALHMAGLLERQGRAVASLTTVDSFTGRGDGSVPGLTARLGGFFGDLTGRPDPLRRLDLPEGGSEARRLADAHDALVTAGLLRRPLESEELTRLFAVYRNNSVLLERHTPAVWPPADAHDSDESAPGTPDPGESAPGANDPARPDPAWLLIRAERTPRDAFPSLLPLDGALPGAGRLDVLPEDHFSVVRGAGAAYVARRVAAVTGAAHGPSDPIPDQDHA
ncbi:amino acid adenylation domain-containing protein [Streptomyces sp. NPDC085466]|uniref:amino acid adenylation domain-containing protein n=1 Tax=Streptomyces sp. NPDC085466 TaxID=3365725 RepID=UPI0037D5640D